jgi:hypothetical protein
MLSMVAEKLMLAAGTYPCQWAYRDQMMSGEMQLEGSRVPVGEMFDAPGTCSNAGACPQQRLP